MLDAGSVVPASIQDDDLAGSGQLRDVALEVPAGEFAVGRLPERHDSRVSWAPVRDDVLDDVVLASSIPSFDEQQHLLATCDHMALKLDEFDLQQAHLGLVLAIGDRPANRPRDRAGWVEVGRCTWCAGRMRSRLMVMHVGVHGNSLLAGKIRTAQGGN